jgi:hypothetical protein
VRYDTKDEATAASVDIQQMMADPSQWALKVWENIGWHCAIVCGPAYIWPCGEDTYSCLISGDPDKAGSGEACWSSHESGNTPEEALQKEIASFRKYKRSREDQLELVEDALVAIAMKETADDHAG